MKKFLCIFLIATTTKAQQISYPQNYFRNPLNIPINLAGNFGECRPGHFHSGIDIKTEGRENLPVHAAADGYISRVKMESSGFGHAIYITHPNGYTTVYAHLNNFYKKLQLTVHQLQYKNKSWTLDQSFSPQDFPVVKGQFIAFSGNTGGSSAPHLHFEIRSTKTEHPLNPQLFGFKIIDNIAPKPSSLALYNAAHSIYNQTPITLPLHFLNNIYSVKNKIFSIDADSVNIGVAVHDYMNQSTNTLAIYTAEWFANDSLVGKLTLDDIGYDKTRYLNACADYQLNKLKDIWYNSLFILPNNQLQHIYTYKNNNKKNILLNNNKSTDIKIILKDVYNNTSIISFALLKGKSPSLVVCNNMWQAGVKQVIAFENIKFELPATALYDNVCPDVINLTASNDKRLSNSYFIGNTVIPIHNYFDINIRSNIPIPFNLRDKVVLINNDKNKQSGRAATNTENGWFTAQSRNLGAYWLEIDTIPPTINAIHKSGTTLGVKKEIRFVVKEDKTSVKSVEGYINKQWVCFEQHGNNWFYKIDEFSKKGVNKLNLTATDESGNVRKIEYEFVH